MKNDTFNRHVWKTHVFSFGSGKCEEVSLNIYKKRTFRGKIKITNYVYADGKERTNYAGNN